MTTARDQALRNAMAEMDHAQATADLLDSLQRGSAMTVEEISEEDFLAWEEVQPPIPNRLLRPQGRKHMVIGDTQQKPRADRRILRWLGQYAVEQKPDVIVHMGDHWDMAGLSYYDRGTRAGEGGR